LQIYYIEIVWSHLLFGIFVDPDINGLTLDERHSSGGAVAKNGASLSIGDNSAINEGTCLSIAKSVRIGCNV